jgi:hypothetical protein
MSEKVNVFISHITEEQVEATKAKEYLERVFKDQIEVFVASSWTSIQPGEDWFKCIAAAIEKADIMLVFSSGDSVGRPWVQFETGAGWFSKKTKVIPVCHKGMTPPALPEPIRRLQAIDINAASEGEQLRKLAEAIKTVANLREPSPISVEALPLGTEPPVRGMPSLRGWLARPGAHTEETLEGVFKVGLVGAPDPSRASECGLDPQDSVYVRLFVEPPTGQFVNAMATGKAADVLESEEAEGQVVVAKLRLAAAYQGHGPDDRPSPLIVVDQVRLRQK